MEFPCLFLYEDESFSFEALRAAGYATYAGAELGEVLVTCRAIPEGDERAWSREWARTAERVETIGRTALAAGHRVSGREALLRASNYYRTADFYRREDPAHDAESARLSARSQETFAAAARLLDHEARPVRIPYEGTTLPGYLYLAPGADGPRPTVLYHGGYDSTLEEDYLAFAAGALRRGYHVLTFDGPGQGSALRAQGLHFRPDWEAVVGPVVDFALALPEADPDRLVLAGTSLGGYLAARAAAFEPRLAALVLHDGVHSLAETVERMTAAPLAELMRRTSTRWVVQNGLWTFGAKDLAEFVELSRSYTLDGVTARISCPTLVLDAENDQFFQGQPDRVFADLTCRKELARFSEADGGGEHCHEGALALWHQRAFDWLDETLSQPETAMTAVRLHAFGGPEVLVAEQVPVPVPGPGEVLVRVHAVGVNPPDWYAREGMPDVPPEVKPDLPLPLVPGTDVSGVVAAVGTDVTGFVVGDEVFGLLGFPTRLQSGAYAGYVTAPAADLAHKPAGVDHVQAAGLAMSALTAWQFLVEVGHDHPSPFQEAEHRPVPLRGKHVLVNGAAGGVGHLAVQLARWQGARVTAVASGRHEAFLRDLGVDAFLDYTTGAPEDVARDLDLVLDTVGGPGSRRFLPTLRRGGALYPVYPGTFEAHEAKEHDVTVSTIQVRSSGAQLEEIARLVADGTVRVAIDSTFPLEQAQAAHERAARGHLQGKIVLTVR